MAGDVDDQLLREAARAKLFGGEAAPTKIGRYRVDRRLGAGGMGVVYVARDDDLDREVAVKLLLGPQSGEGSTGQARLIREARAMAKLSHPNTVHVYEVGKADDRVFIAMEYIRGQTLRQWTADAERSWSEILAEYVEAGRGLAAAHAAGIVHRDFKPENVLVGDDGRPRVLDFGLARPDSPMSTADVGEADTVNAESATQPVELSLTQTGTLLGTPAYMSPEQFKGEGVDARSDQYSFCAALFEALYGDRPFAGDSVVELSASVLKDEVREVDPSKHGVPQRVHRAILRGLSRAAAHRFETIDELLDELEAEVAPAVADRRRWWLAGLGVGALAIAGVLAAAGRGSTVERAPAVADAVDPWAEIVDNSALLEPMPEPLPDDPLQVTVHRLRNGLTVYVAPVRDQPRISTRVVVHAGSRHEEEGASGVAHLLEHMMFKGTPTIGALNWEAERPLLEQRDAVAAKLENSTDPAGRAELLAEIGRLEAEAAKHAAPAEFSNILTDLGATSINATTDRSATTFISDIPSARLEAWAELEAERLRNPVFRGFFSELGVLESEYAMALQPTSSFYNPMFAMVFGEGPDGHMTIGELDDLQRPPLAAMKAFQQRYYVPNNMSIVLVGDIDVDRALSVLRAHFGDWEPAAVPKAPPQPEPVLGPPQRKTVAGNWFIPLVIAWRDLPPEHPDLPKAEALTWLLGGRGGLLQERLVSKGLATVTQFAQFQGVMAFWGLPAPGRTPEQLEADLMALLEDLSRGNVDPKRLQSRPAELSMEMMFADRDQAAGLIAYYVGRRRPWGDALAGHTEAQQPKASDIVTAAKYLVEAQRNVLVQGDEPYQPPALDFPTIPPVQFVQGARSDRAKALLAAPVSELEPQFVVAGRNYQARGSSVIVSQESSLYELQIRIPMGLADDPLACDAARMWMYAPPPGTDLDTWERVRDEAGVVQELSCGNESTTLILLGLSRLYPEAMKWWEATYHRGQIDDAMMAQWRDLLIEYKASQLQPGVMADALEYYALQGTQSYYRLAPEIGLLRSAPPRRFQAVVDRMRGLAPSVTYYGPEASLPKLALDELQAGAPPAPRRLPRPERPRILVLHEPSLKQADVRLLYPRQPLTPGDDLMKDLFNAYLSGGMSSLLSTELREARGLGYVAYGALAAGRRERDDAYARVVVNVPAPRVVEAVAAVREVLAIPISDERFERVRRYVEQKYRTSRLSPREIPDAVLYWRDRGHAADPKLQSWSRLPSVTAQEFEAFYRDTIASAPYVVVVGNTEAMDLDALREIGAVEAVEASDILSSAR